MSYFTLLMCGFVVVVVGKAQELCTTPGGIEGICTNVYRCNTIVELIQKTQQLTSYGLVQEIKRYECGRDVYATKVCCPPPGYDAASSRPDRNAQATTAPDQPVHLDPKPQVDLNPPSELDPPPELHPQPQPNQPDDSSVQTDLPVQSQSDLYSGSSPYPPADQLVGTEPIEIVTRPPPDIPYLTHTPSSPTDMQSLVDDQPIAPDVSVHRNVWLLPVNCGEAAEERIIKGDLVEILEFPWMALLAVKTDSGLEFKCDGTLINQKYILTSARCAARLKTDISLATVRIGEFDIGTEQDCETHDVTICSDPYQDFSVEESVPHPNFFPGSTDNDIGLIRIHGTINFTESVRPICLPLHKIDSYPFLKKMTSAGWGRAENGSKSNILMRASLFIKNIELCSKFYEGALPSLTPRQICASREHKDTCDGDNGGPLMSYVYDSGKFYQHGVDSHRPKTCTQRGSPVVFTSVRFYMDWVLDTIKA